MLPLSTHCSTEGKDEEGRLRDRGLSDLASCQTTTIPHERGLIGKEAVYLAYGYQGPSSLQHAR